MFKSKTIWVIMIFIVFISSCKKNVNTQDNPSDYTHKLTILYTNDEHGWIEKTEFTNGAANLMGQWISEEEYDGDESFLILSGGDNWTGPAISTWFEGESVVEVMNAMEYDAVALGNHEFDFKVEVLEERIAEANFPFLAANIRNVVDGEIPDFATPYIIKEIDGVLIGIIGLSNVDTPWTTFPEHVADYEFIDYSIALQEIVPQVKAEGAEILIAVTHLCQTEMSAISNTLIELGISVIGGGHCRGGIVATIVKTSRGQFAMIKGEDYMQGYAKLEILYDSASKEIVDIEIGGSLNNGNEEDITVAEIVTKWRAKTDDELGEVIGYADEEIVRGTAELSNLVVDSWLFSYPNANIAMNNGGGIRQSIPAGELTLASIVSVLPFLNNIIELQLTGAEVIEVSQMNDIILGGMTSIGGYKLLDGTPIEANTTYNVLFTDYLYIRNSLSQYDSNPYYTGMNYSQPTIDYITSLNTSSADPLNNYLDGTSRR